MSQLSRAQWRASVAAALLAAGSVSAQGLIVKIGHAGPTSGWLASVGIENENSARLAIEELNASALRIGSARVTFELVAVDDAMDVGKARTAAAALVAAQVRAVVGHFSSDTAIAAAQTYADAGVPQIAAAATSPLFTRLGLKTAFRVIADDTIIGQLLARHVVAGAGASRLAIIEDGTLYGRTFAEEFARTVAAAGARVVASQRVDKDTTDFTLFLAAAKAAGAEAILFAGLEDRQAGKVLQQMHRLGMDAKFIVGDGNCTPDLVSFWAVGAAHDDQVVCALPGGIPTDAAAPAAAARFLADYAKRFGRAPRYYGPYAYDAVKVIADAMVRAGSAEPSEYLRALAETRDHEGATGTIAFDARGDVRQATVNIFTYRGEERRFVRAAR